MKLTLQFTLLVGFLFFGVLLGINTAEKGIHQIEGASSNVTSQALKVTPSKPGEVEVAVLGKKYTAQTPIPDMEKIKSSEIVQGAGNRISRIGNDLGTLLKEGTRSGLEWFFGWIEKRLG
jgi:hypothetical protein